jgi:hypothetical protein
MTRTAVATLEPDERHRLLRVIRDLLEKARRLR